MNEIIIKDGQTCLTRENLVTLGLRREMDSMVGIFLVLSNCYCTFSAIEMN